MAVTCYSYCVSLKHQGHAAGREGTPSNTCPQACALQVRPFSRVDFYPQIPSPVSSECQVGIPESQTNNLLTQSRHQTYRHCRMMVIKAGGFPVHWGRERSPSSSHQRREQKTAGLGGSTRWEFLGKVASVVRSHLGTGIRSDRTVSVHVKWGSHRHNGWGTH